MPPHTNMLVPQSLALQDTDDWTVRTLQMVHVDTHVWLTSWQDINMKLE